MSRHVPAHRIADLLSGDLGPSDAASVRAHLDECESCGARAARVEQAGQVLRDAASEPAPALGWDLIWARIRWSTSFDERTRRRVAERRWRIARWALPALGAAAVLAAFAVPLLQPDRPQPIASPAMSASPAPLPEAPVEPLVAAEPLVGVITMTRGQVWVDSSPVRFDEPLGAGAIIETGEGGGVAVQFGDGSAFSVGSNSSLRVRALDTRSIVLDIQGRVDVEVSKRADDQLFAVVAGERRVEVRGTAFRVDNRGGELDVACGHGHVVVIDTLGQVDLRAGQTLSILDALARREPVTVPASERAALERSLLIPKVPDWTHGADVLRRSGRLLVEAPVSSPASVDGRRIAAGAFALRVAPGRHRIDAAGHGEWVEVASGAERRAVARARVRPSVERKQQLEEALAEREVTLRRCVARLDREGVLAGTSIELELGVNKDGSQGFLNILDTNLPTEAAHCLRDAVDEIEFPRGARATVRETIAF